MENIFQDKLNLHGKIIGKSFEIAGNYHVSYNLLILEDKTKTPLPKLIDFKTYENSNIGDTVSVLMDKYKFLDLQTTNK